MLEGKREVYLKRLLGEPEGGPADNAESAEQYDELRRAVDSLSEQSRQVVMLVYFQGLKYREAADVLGVPVGTVESRLHRDLGGRPRVLELKISLGKEPANP